MFIDCVFWIGFDLKCGTERAPTFLLLPVAQPVEGAYLAGAWALQTVDLGRGGE